MRFELLLELVGRFERVERRQDQRRPFGWPTHPTKAGQLDLATFRSHHAMVSHTISREWTA
jgi:hypothetical protein